VGQHPEYGLARRAEFHDELDSGLRRNDGVAGFACCRQLWKPQ
jgi:hypothetical protein